MTIFRTVSNPFQHKVCQTIKAKKFPKHQIFCRNNILKTSSLLQNPQKHTETTVNAGFPSHCDATIERERMWKVRNSGIVTQPQGCQVGPCGDKFQKFGPK